MKRRIGQSKTIKLSLYKKSYNKLSISWIYNKHTSNYDYDMRSVGVWRYEGAYRFVLTSKKYLKIQFNINNLKY